MFGFILRNHKKGLVYIGDTIQLDSCLDPKSALTWWEKRPEGFKSTEYTGKVYGRKQVFVLPYMDAPSDDSEEINSEFIEYIIYNAKMKLISDIVLGLWMELLKEFDVYKSSNGFVYFVIHSPLDEDTTTKDINEEAKYILMKEFMDGYSYFDKYEFKQGKEKVPLQIAHDYQFGDINIPYNYTLALRKAMFGANQGQNIGSQKLLMDWQYDVIKNMGKKTVIFGPRRVGKTFLLAFLARREIMAQKLNFQNQYRPVNVIYLGLSDAKNYKVVQYLKGMDKMFSKNAEGMFHYSSDQKMYSFRSGKDILGTISFISAEQKDPGVGEYADLIIIDEAIKIPNHIWELLEPIITNEGARLITASTLYYNAPKNRNYDLMLEAEKHTIGKDIYKIIDVNFEKFKELSKGNRSKENRLEYQTLVNEFHDENEWVGLRYTIDDIEYMPEQRREHLKEDMWTKNAQRYYAELYSRYADEGKVFNYNGCLVDLSKHRNTAYKYITTVHDSALTYDESAVLVGAWNENIRKIVLLEEHVIKKTGYYEDQAKQVKEIISDSVKYSVPQDIDMQLKPIWDPMKSDTFFICDGNQKATAELFQMTGLNIDLRMTYSSKGEHESKSSHIYNEINIPKKNLIEIAQKMLDNNFILIPGSLKKLLNEFDGYYQTTDPVTGTIKYSRGHSDDFIHAFMMLCYFFYEKLNLKHELVKRTDIKKPQINKKGILEKKYNEHLEKIKKHQQEANTRLNQIYFHNHVY